MLKLVLKEKFKTAKRRVLDLNTPPQEQYVYVMIGKKSPAKDSVSYEPLSAAVQCTLYMYIQATGGKKNPKNM